MDISFIFAVLLAVTGLFILLAQIHEHDYETSWRNRFKYKWTATVCTMCGKAVSYEEATKYYQKEYKDREASKRKST